MLWDDLGFATHYEVDGNPEYPGDGVWGIREIELREALSATPVAKVTPQSGAPWLLDSGFRGIGAIYGTPDPELLCVVERHEHPVFINVVDPLRSSTLQIEPIRVAAALDEQLLLLADWQSITAWGLEGVRWTSGLIVEYDLHIRRTDNGRIVCSGTNYEATERVEVTLDAATGRIID